jgi:hypothetical protein
MLHMFHTCCKSMFQWFQLFQSFVAVSVFMLQVASVLPECCMCFTHMFQVQMYLPNVSSAFQTYVIFECFMFHRSVHRVMRHGRGTEGSRAVSQVLEVGTHSVPRSRGWGACSSSSRLPPTWRKRSGVAGKEPWA